MTDDGVTVHFTRSEALRTRIALMNQAFYYERKGQEAAANEYRGVSKKVADGQGDAIEGDDTQRPPG